MVVCEHNDVIIRTSEVVKTIRMSAAKKVNPLSLLCFPLFVRPVEVALEASNLG